MKEADIPGDNDFEAAESDTDLEAMELDTKKGMLLHKRFQEPSPIQ